MALTRDFKETILKRVREDDEFRKELLREAVQLLLEGDLEIGKSVLRDFINATIGFQQLGAITGTPPKSLMRMLSQSGNPTASNLLNVVSKLQEREGIALEVHARRRSA